MFLNTQYTSVTTFCSTDTPNLFVLDGVLMYFKENFVINLCDFFFYKVYACFK